MIGASVLAVALGLFPLRVYGDNCGSSEEWVVEPARLLPDVFDRTISVMTVSLSSTASLAIPQYLKKGDAFSPDGLIPAANFLPISQMPDCGVARHPLHTARFPVYELKEGYAKVLINAKTGVVTWLRPTDFGGVILHFDSIAKGAQFTTAFSPKSEGIEIWPFPEGGTIHTYIPHGELIEAYGVSGDFLLLKAFRYNEKAKDWESVNIGWIRFRSPEGKLLVWPWYADEC